MSDLKTLPNIGPVLVGLLERAEVHSAKELRRLGAEAVFIRLKILETEEGDSCIHILYALEGAVQGVRWHGVSKERKQELLDFFSRLQQDTKKQVLQFCL
jgi:DNA transformation protein